MSSPNPLRRLTAPEIAARKGREKATIALEKQNAVTRPTVQNPTGSAVQ